MYLRKYYMRKAFVIIFSMFFIGLFGGIILVELDGMRKVEPAQATFFNVSTGVGDNVNGFAWSPNFGWISFNSSDCDIDGNSSFDDATAPAGCPNSSVDFFDYGVNVETGTGSFSGFAWSNNFGWIYFGPDATLGLYGDISETDAPESPFYWANYSFATKKVTGWAKALALSDDGWIKFDGTWTSGVSIDSVNGDFSGFAWNGNTTNSGIGWISFNCLDIPKSCNGGTAPGNVCLSDTDCLGGGACVDTCDISDYKVIGNLNQAPEAKELEAPYYSKDYLCENGVNNAILKWNFSDPDVGAYESAYQIIFDDDNNPDDPMFTSPKCDFASTLVDCLIGPGVGQYPISNLFDLSFGGNYFWWVKVWDEYDVESEWAASTDWSAEFSVPGHKLPKPVVDPTFKPAMPNSGEEVHFEGNSDIFKFNAPGSPIECKNDPLNCTWLWSVTPSYYAHINDPATTSPIIIFDNSEQDFFVTLSTTDNDGFTCTSVPVVVNPKIDLPTWVEIKTKN